MPTVFRHGPYRFYFHSHEPAHVHVDRDSHSAKIWLGTVSAARNRGFSAVELRRVLRSVKQNRARLLEAWDDHHKA